MPDTKAMDKKLWMKQLEPIVLQLDQTPLIAAPKELDLQKMNAAISKAWGMPVEISLGHVGWRGAQEIKEGMEDAILPQQIVFPSIGGNAFWLMGKHDLFVMTKALIQGEDSDIASLVDSELGMGIYTYFASSAISQLDSLLNIASFSPRLAATSSVPAENCFSIDVDLKLSQSVVKGRICLSEALYKAWQKQFVKEKSWKLDSELAERVLLSVQVEAGRSALKPREWAQIKRGDIVILDDATYNPRVGSKRLNLSVNGKRFLRGRYEADKGELTLRDYPLYQEEVRNLIRKGQAMAEELKAAAESKGEMKKPEEHVEPSSMAASNDPSKGAAKEAPATLPHQEPTIETAKAGEPTAEHAEEKSGPPVKLSIEELSVVLVAEVARLKMPLSKLLSLQPGNVLQLDASPESGVTLMVEDRVVGKGELVQIGDAMGVRITDLG